MAASLHWLWLDRVAKVRLQRSLAFGHYCMAFATSFVSSAAMKGKLLTIEFIGAGTNNTTLALTNVQGGSAATTATFNAANETLVLSGGELKWNVLKEVGVTLA